MSGPVDLTRLGFAVPDAVERRAPDVFAALLGAEDDPTAAARDTLSDEDLGSMEAEFHGIAALTERKRELKAELKQVGAQLDVAKERMLDVMRAQGTTQFRSGAGLGSCHVQERFDTTVEDPTAFVAWVQERHPELLTVNAQARNRFIREEYRNAGVAADSEQLPPGITVTPRVQLAVHGARPAQPE